MIKKRVEKIVGTYIQYNFFLLCWHLAHFLKIKWKKGEKSEMSKVLPVSSCRCENEKFYNLRFLVREHANGKLEINCFHNGITNVDNLGKSIKLTSSFKRYTYPDPRLKSLVE